MPVFEKPSDPASVPSSEVESIELNTETPESTAVKPVPTVATTHIEEWR